MAEVCILLATYNGSSYIRQQVDSLLAQTYGDFHLILSDDGSKDNTPELLEDYARTYPEKITHYRSGRRFGCAQDHFMHLLEQFRDSPYIMFCDQDDFWHADKIEKTMEVMRRIEQPGIPAMVHTDLRVVDGELKEMDGSFMRFSKLCGTRLALHQLLVQNAVTGCTMMLNKALADLACEHMPGQRVLMHDWWLALLASACGQTGFVPEATIDYRQHGNNSVGAKSVYSPSYLLGRLRSKQMRGALADAAAQAELFLQCYSEQLSPRDRQLVAAFASTKDASLFRRDAVYLRHGLLKYGSVRILAQLLGW